MRRKRRESFPLEITALHNAKRSKTDDDVKGQRFKNAAGRNSPLRQLDPFLSEDGLIRVGGRLAGPQSVTKQDIKSFYPGSIT